MASLVAYNAKTKAWYARPSTVSQSTTVVFIGPRAVPNPPSFVEGVDVRIYPDAGSGGY